jgi:hypothetical protein
MERRRLAGFGLALGLVALSGCVEAPAPGVVAVADLPPPTVAMVAVVPSPEAAVWVPPPRHHVAAVHHVATVHRAVATRHWVRRYHHAQAYYAPRTPQCGSDVRPCNPEHVETPFP